MSNKSCIGPTWDPIRVHTLDSPRAQTMPRHINVELKDYTKMVDASVVSIKIVILLAKHLLCTSLINQSLPLRFSYLPFECVRGTKMGNGMSLTDFKEIGLLSIHLSIYHAFYHRMGRQRQSNLESL